MMPIMVGTMRRSRRRMSAVVGVPRKTLCCEIRPEFRSFQPPIPPSRKGRSRHAAAELAGWEDHLAGRNKAKDAGGYSTGITPSSVTKDMSAYWHFPFVRWNRLTASSQTRTILTGNAPPIFSP